MQYIGEHLLPGQLGRFFVTLGFVAAVVASLSYFFATQRRDTPEYSSWRKMGRLSYLVHGVSILSVMSCMFYVMTYKYYEYAYAQAHVSDELPFRYIFSAFWEGQEGSFCLWMFWHIVLGGILIWKSKEWETATMSVLSLIQVLISSMILGAVFNFGFGEFKIGANPMMFLRDTMDAPIFQKANYVTLIKGKGLNPLLQNYWMTIHPPTLFLGFASTSIPFCFAIAGLWMRKHTEWLRPVLRWSLFSGTILGTGILMGGAWAYEALSFGGYWAWDPVENMSLVPWLILIAGIHTNLIANSTGNAIKSTYLYYIFTFVLIVYSTFLTRSGILGDTSVHAFTEMGLEWQLVAFLFLFLGIGLFMFFKNNKNIPTILKEEELSSREFWMFIGTLVLLFSGLIITYTTSIPVYNKVSAFFGKPLNISPPTDAVAHYNKYQLWIGVFMGILSAFTQFLRYKETRFANYKIRFAKHIGIALLISAALTFLGTTWINAKAWQYVVLLFAAIFTCVANIQYVFYFLKNNLKASGSAIAHLGFGLMIIGTLASGLNKTFISSNKFAQDGIIEGADEDYYQKNIILLKGVSTMMKGYEVTYVQDTTWDFNRRFTVHYGKKDDNGNTVEEFDLYPNVIYDKTFTKIAASNPDTKHYWNKDIFTDVSSLPKSDTDPVYRQKMEDSLKYLSVSAIVGDTFFTKQFYGIIEGVNLAPKSKDYDPHPGDLPIGVKVSMHKLDDPTVYYAEPMVVYRDKEMLSLPARIGALQVSLRLPENTIENAFVSDEKLKYQNYSLTVGQEVTVDGNKISFREFDKNGKHPNYKPEQGDIPVNANFKVTDATGKQFDAKPLFLIRENRPYNIKDEVSSLGLHIRLLGINPATGAASIAIAQSSAEQRRIHVEVAENSPSNEYIVLQAIVFPGINYFWVGTIMMMLGLGISMFMRLKPKFESHLRGEEIA